MAADVDGDWVLLDLAAKKSGGGSAEHARRGSGSDADSILRAMLSDAMKPMDASTSSGGDGVLSVPGSEPERVGTYIGEVGVGGGENEEVEGEGKGEGGVRPGNSFQKMVERGLQSTTFSYAENIEDASDKREVSVRGGKKRVEIFRT